MKSTLKGLTVKLYTKNGKFYSGEVIDEDDTHVTIIDEYNDEKREIMLNREWITEINKGRVQ